MMDIVEKLRGSEWRDVDKKEAADEIERLRAALEEIHDVYPHDTQAHRLARNALKQSENPPST